MSHAPPLIAALPPPNVRRGEYLLLLLVLVLCTMHLLRNVSIVFPLAYFASASLLLLCGMRRGVITLPQVLITACYAYVALVSTYHAQDHGDLGIGLVRLLYLSPLVIYLFGARLDAAQVDSVWKYLLIFSTFCAASLYYQQLAGPIGWFAEASERAGTTRYASLAGSLTAFGSIVGPATYLAWIRIDRPVLRIGLVLFFLVAAVLSLQKAAIAGLLLGVLLGVFARGLRGNALRIANFAIAALVLAILATKAALQWIPPELQEALSMFVRGAIGEDGSDDFPILESIRQRFWDYPVASTEFFGTTALLLGAGVYGASGALGYPHLPMMHNLLGEVLVVAGLPIFLFFIGTSLYCLVRSVRALAGGVARDPRAAAAAGVFVLTFVVGLNTGTVHFHPVIGIFYWLGLRELTHRRVL